MNNSTRNDVIGMIESRLEAMAKGSDSLSGRARSRVRLKSPSTWRTSPAPSTSLCATTSSSAVTA